MKNITKDFFIVYRLTKYLCTRGTGFATVQCQKIAVSSCQVPMTADDDQVTPEVDLRRVSRSRSALLPLLPLSQLRGDVFQAACLTVQLRLHHTPEIPEDISEEQT